MTISIPLNATAKLLLLFFLTAASLKTNSQSATKVVITTQPVPGYSRGTPMAVQPVVEIRDASDQLVTTSTAQVEISIASGNGGLLGGTTRINAVNGIATFTNVTFSGLQNEPYSFQFKSEPVVLYEPFAYGAGTLTGRNGGTGWSGAWFNANPAFTDLVVNTTGFTYTNFTTTGGRSSYTSSTGGDGGRMLSAVSNTNQTVLWLAFLANYDQQGGGFSNVRLYLPGGLSGGVGGNGGITHWSILNNGLGAGASTTTPLNGVMRLALLKIDYTAGTSALWMDPVVATFDGTQTPSMTETFAPVFDRIELYNRSAGVGTDEITLASTYKAALHLEENLIADVSAAAILPVQWAYFNASCEGDQTLLKWGTTNEVDNSHFLVERSVDAKAWSAIGKVAGNGNSGLAHQYQFAEPSSLLKTYYRLRQVDFDGNTNLSKVVVMSCGSIGSVQVFPNPAGEFVQFAGATPGSRYILMNALGYAVRAGVASQGNTTVSLAGLAKGNYFLRMTDHRSRTLHILKAGR